jgi:hypothetical protein
MDNYTELQMQAARDAAKTHGTDRFEKLTKREYFASQLMASLAQAWPENPPANLAANAVSYADALIDALNTPKCPRCRMSNGDGHYDADHSICPREEKFLSEQ